MKTEKQYLKDYQAPDFKIEKAHFYFNLHESKTLVFAEMNFKTIQPADLILNGENLKLLEVQLNDKILSTDQYSLTETHLTISQSTLGTDNTFNVKTKVEINPESNKSCEGLYLSQGIFCTQCEAESFRKITYFLDRPDVLTKYTVEIEADQKKYPLLLSNGDCIEKKILDNGRHYAKWIDPFSKPSYLFALVAGDMGCVTDTFITKSGRKVQLDVFAPHGKQQRSLHALKSLQQAMKWDEDTYDLEYDLGQYMVVSIDDFNMGAMENKGLNIFNSKLVLADEKTATDDDFHQIQSVIGHEYFHNWSGNRVTCRNWFELSLKEGLTVFRDQEFSADMTSRHVQRIQDVESLRTSQFSEDASPNAHAVRPASCIAVDNFYTATIYEKGAEVIRMLQTIVGRENFKKGLAHYFKKYDGMAVTIDDFCLAISEANQNMDLTHFKLWYSQAGTPLVTVIENYEEASKTYTLKLKQSCPLTVKEKEESDFIKKPFYIPLKFGLITQLGQEVKTESDLLILDQAEKSWVFKNLDSKPVLSLNREFSAPVKIQHELSTEDSLHLIKYDTDDFIRRESGYRMFNQELLRLIHLADQKIDLAPDQNIVDAFGSILKNNKIEPYVKSLMLTLPSSTVLAQEMIVIRPENILKARISFVQSLVKNFKNDIMALYDQHHKNNSIGDRALKNLLLNYLNWIEDHNSFRLAQKQFNEAKNMTDQIAALSIMNNYDTAESRSALQQFHDQWSSDFVVYNKWLQTISSSVLNKNTFQIVLEASRSKSFDAKNPNNLFSLHRTFGGNLVQFHSSKAETYTWLSDEIIRVDQLNPQVAARLAQCFSLTPKLEVDLKDKARKAISKILKFEKLSGNTKEILEKYTI
jgi:aminopeptidase N